MRAGAGQSSACFSAANTRSSSSANSGRSRTLVANPRFNQPAGVAWFYDGVFYVAAKAFAETLQHYAWIAA